MIVCRIGYVGIGDKGNQFVDGRDKTGRSSGRGQSTLGTACKDIKQQEQSWEAGNSKRERKSGTVRITDSQRMNASE